MHKNGSKVIRFSDDKFMYKDNKTVSEFDWADYQGYKTTTSIPYQVLIKDRKYGATRFSYYAFYSAKRKKTIEMLQSKCD